MHIQRNQLTKVLYLRPDVLGNRVIYIIPFWDGKNWYSWIPEGSELKELKPLDLSRGEYVAKTPASGTDIFIQFIDFIWQRASWPEIHPLIAGIISDFENLATIIAKN